MNSKTMYIVFNNQGVSVMNNIYLDEYWFMLGLKKQEYNHFCKDTAKYVSENIFKISKYCFGKQNKTTENVFNGLSIVRNSLVDNIENVDFTRFSASYDNLASLEFGRHVFNAVYAKDNGIDGSVFGYTIPSITKMPVISIGYKDDKLGLLEGLTDGIIFDFFLKDTEKFIEFIKIIKGYYLDSPIKNTEKGSHVLRTGFGDIDVNTYYIEKLKRHNDTLLDKETKINIIKSDIKRLEEQCEDILLQHGYLDNFFKNLHLALTSDLFAPVEEGVGFFSEKQNVSFYIHPDGVNKGEIEYRAFSRAMQPEIISINPDLLYIEGKNKIHYQKDKFNSKFYLGLYQLINDITNYLRNR